MKDSNVLIAEFMGYELEGEFWVATMSNEDDTFLGRHLLFHTSWDWIMPVVKKIKLMHVYLHSWKMITNPSDYPVDKVHEQVVEFIKQHNKKA